MTTRTFTKGLHDIGRGHYAYLQPSGTWGYSNAGLVTDGDEALLVDTLFDERLTDEMLREMKDATGFGADNIRQLVNSHANGDHTFGNRLLKNATIVSSEAGAHEMDELPPERVAAMMRNAPNMGMAGRFIQKVFKDFDFEGIVLRKPDRTFSGQTTLKVGDKDVNLIEVGPAHTQGDVLVHVPADRVIYTGDILFIEGTPIAWAGPVKNWIAACDLIVDLDADVIVPGHGPLTDKSGVRRMQDYLKFVQAEARRRYEAGMDAWEAAQDISLGAFGVWEDAERIVVTVDTLYREFRGEQHIPPDVTALIGKMAEYHYARTGAHDHSHR